MLLLSTEPQSSGLKKPIYNPFCDADKDSISNMLNEELNIDSVDMDLENESETSVVACSHLLKMQVHNLTFCQRLSPRISDTSYVHSIIPNHGKLTGDVCNLPSEKPFISRIVLSLMDRIGLSMSDIEGYHLFTDRYFSGKTVHLVAQQAFKNP
jgi:hypothetical protein